MVGERRGAHQLGDRLHAVGLDEQADRLRAVLAPARVAMLDLPARDGATSREDDAVQLTAG